MKQSAQVNAQIKKHYSHGVGQYPDLAKELRNDLIDYNVPSIYPAYGCDVSYDESLFVIYYADESALVISSCGIVVL